MGGFISVAASSVKPAFVNSLMLLVGYELNVSIAHLKADAEKRTKLEEGETSQKLP